MIEHLIFWGWIYLALVVGVIIGFFLCAAITVGKEADRKVDRK